MSNILLIISVILFIFIAKSAYSGWRHFECTGFRKSGKLCEHICRISDDENSTTTCLKCGSNIFFNLVMYMKNTEQTLSSLGWGL